MRKIIASMWTTLDNFVAGPNDEMDWLRIDERVMAYEQSFVDDAEMLLLGRSTFGDFAGYWPKAARNPNSDPAERKYAQRVDALKKTVVSASGRVAQWGNTEVLSTLDEKHLAALKDGGGGYIAIYGSLSVIGTLTRLWRDRRISSVGPSDRPGCWKINVRQGQPRLPGTGFG